MKKIIDFPKKLADQVQEYANNNHNGNFTKSVIEICSYLNDIEQIKKNHDYIKSAMVSGSGVKEPYKTGDFTYSKTGKPLEEKKDDK